jgi:hypothetical protein
MYPKQERIAHCQHASKQGKEDKRQVRKQREIGEEAIEHLKRPG